MLPPKVIEKLGRRIEKLKEWRYAWIMDVPLEMAETMQHLRRPLGDDLALRRASNELGHVAQMLAHEGPYLLEVMVEKEDNVFPMVPTGASVSEIRLA
mgnify:CR=1 FL=1